MSVFGHLSLTSTEHGFYSMPNFSQHIIESISFIASIRDADAARTVDVVCAINIVRAVEDLSSKFTF